MHIAFITRETDLLGASSVEASVPSGLAKALRGHDHQTTLVLPMTSDIDPGQHALARKLRKLKVERDGETREIEVYTGRAVSGVELVLLRDESFAEAASFDDAASAHFAQAVEVFVAQAEDIDIVHGHGDIGATVTRHVRGKFPTVLTTDAEAAEAADEVISHSGAGTNVPLGLDASRFNPVSDPHLGARFDPVDMSGKAKNKATLQRELGLPIRGDVPLIGIDGTESPEELDRFAAIASALLRNDVQIVVHATGAHSRLEGLAARWPDRLQVRADLGDAFSHRMLGACELWVVLPDVAKLEVRHMRGQRYGAVPVAHATGCIGDALIDCDAHLTTGTGFVARELGDDEILATLQRAVAAFAQREAFAELQNRVMRIDQSWDRSARVHDRLYQALLGATAAA